MPFVLKLEELGRIHFTGVCGTAMASVAGELKRMGCDVTGSDSGTYPPMSTFLAQCGVQVVEGFAAENLIPHPDLVVVGNAVSRGNPEVEYVLRHSLQYCSLPELIESVFLPGTHPVVVTGTHGKTTTSALIAWILKENGQDPSWLIGGVPKGLGGGFRLGKGKPFVIEGDEYDTAFFDKRPKFIHYRPKTLILNNIEYDHADIYPDMGRIREVFAHLLRIVPSNGQVIACADDVEVMALVKDSLCPVTTYSIKGADADWRAAVHHETLTVTGPGIHGLEVAHSLIGVHQGWNTMAALISCVLLGVDVRAAANSITSFQGVRRRSEKVGEAYGIEIYDDFAHHPSSIEGTLEGFRLRYPTRRIWAVVEPRSNTMRRAVFQERLANSFAAADHVVIREVFDPERSPDGDRLDVARLATEIGEGGTPAVVLPNGDAIVEHISKQALPGDVVVILSNGGFEDIHTKLLHAFELKEMD